MKNKILLFTLLLICAAGCAPRTAWETSTLPAPTLPGSATLLPPSATLTATETATATLPPPTLTRTLIPPTPTKEGAAVLHQLKMLPVVPATASLQGVWVLGTPIEVHAYYKSTWQQLELWDLQTGNRQSLIPAANWVAANVSITADGGLLAYRGIEHDATESGGYQMSLHIVSATGQEQSSLPYEDSWGQMSGWLDNERLVIRRDSGVSALYSNFSARWVVNPFTGAIQELPQDPEDIVDIYPWPEWEEVGLISYNPALTYRAYHSEDWELALEDIQSNKVVVRIPIRNSGIAPRWSPDGRELAVVGGKIGEVWNYDELWLVSMDGAILQLTHFEDEFGAVGDVSFSYLSWSPDGRKIACWMSNSKREIDIDRGKLAVLDLDTTKVTIYSVESSRSASQMLIWSPDGRYILTGVVSTDYKNVSTVLIDLEEGWSVEVAKGMSPLGWMVIEP